LIDNFFFAEIRRLSRKPRNANSSAIGTVTTAARTRITSHVIRAGAGPAVSSAAIPRAEPVPAIRSSAIQRIKTIPPTTGAAQPNLQLRLAYCRLKSNKVPAAAKSGTLAPSDVFVPAGPTGLDPGQTSFFQALNIATKIARGSIEIVANVHLIKHGEKVTSSHVALLGKLDIKPFFYGVVVTNVYENGSMYPAAILDITPDQLLAKFFGGVRRIAAIGLAVGYPTEASIPHTIANGFKRLLAISQSTGFEFTESKAFFQSRGGRSRR